MPVPGFGGSAKDLCDIPDIGNALTDELRNLDVGSDGWIQILTTSVRSVLDAFPRVLIIHGRGDTGDDLRKRIREAAQDKRSDLFGIADPEVMNLSGQGAISVPDVFESLASSVSAAIAIVTADDIGGFARGDDKRDLSAKELKLTPRARENVWVEVGWFWGRLGRERVFLWLKDDVKLPSDLQGAASTYATELDGAWESMEAFIAQLRQRDPQSGETEPSQQAPAVAQERGKVRVQSTGTGTKRGRAFIRFDQRKE